jgi:hypothetical protein
LHGTRVAAQRVPAGDAGSASPRRKLSQSVANPSSVQACLADCGDNQLHGVIRAGGSEVRASLKSFLERRLQRGPPLAWLDKQRENDTFGRRAGLCQEAAASQRRAAEDLALEACGTNRTHKPGAAAGVGD